MRRNTNVWDVLIAGILTTAIAYCYTVSRKERTKENISRDMYKETLDVKLAEMRAAVLRGE